MAVSNINYDLKIVTILNYVVKSINNFFSDVDFKMDSNCIMVCHNIFLFVFNNYYLLYLE